MPTVKNIPGPYRFFFYSFNCHEPKHVHVRHENRVCKFWIEPISLFQNYGFTSTELNKIRKMIFSYIDIIKEAWDEHCE